MSGYHHGDLRRALLDEAASVLSERGVGALSLRDLARRVGVSATAPYHHFPNKASLVTALADDALAALDAALAAADLEAVRAGSSPGGRLTAIGVAYVVFAVDHPERFRLAFRPEMGNPFDGMAHGDALPDDLVGFRHLVRVVGDLEADPARRAPMALGAWSVAHGLASLLVDGPLRAIANDRDRVLETARSVLT